MSPPTVVLSVVLMHKASQTGWAGRHEHAVPSLLTSLWMVSKNQVELFQGVLGVTEVVRLKMQIDFVGPVLI